MIVLAKIISNIFNPVIVAPGAFAILINQASNPGSNRMLIWLIVLFFATIVPIVAMLWLKKKGAITDLDVSLREQRLIPLLIGIFSYGAAYVILEWLNADHITKGLVFCSLTNIIIVTVITRYWKISIHAAGLTGPLAALWVLWNSYAFPMAALAALVGTSRVILKAHTPSQVVVGSIFGFVLTIVQLKLFFI